GGADGGHADRLRGPHGHRRRGAVPGEGPAVGQPRRAGRGPPHHARRPALLGDAVPLDVARFSGPPAEERTGSVTVPQLALEFPPVSRLVEWKTIFLGGPFAVNKVVLLMWAAVIIVLGLFFGVGRTAQLVPTGVQNLVESIVEFVTDNIILQTMGPEGLFWAPFLVTMFTFVFICNIFEVVPLIQMPVNARIA